MRLLSDDAKRGLEDLYFFLKECWGLDLEEQPHRKMCDTIQESELNPEKPYAFLIVPRGTYKSSIGRGAVVWKQLRQIYIYENFYHRIALASAVLSFSQTSMRLIGEQLRHNRKLKEWYGTLYLDNRHDGLVSKKPEGIILAPRLVKGEIPSVSEPNFWIASILRVSVGFHADGALIDDLNNDKNTATDVQREKVKEYWQNMFPLIQREDRNGNPSTIILNATPWHDDDVRGMVIRQEKEKKVADPGYKSPYNVYWAPAITDNGELFFPSKLNTKQLEELREEMSPRKFAANYLCDPVGDRGFVREDQIRFKPRAYFPKLHDVRATVDPNQHTDAKVLGCYCAIAISGYDSFANLYFLNFYGSREWSSKQFIDCLFDITETYDGIPILIENEHMAHFQHAIRLEEERRVTGEDGRITPRIKWINAPREPKYLRWEKLQPRFASGRVFFAEEIPVKLKHEITEELIRGQASRFHDFLDVMSMAEHGIRPRVDKEGRVKDRDVDHPEEFHKKPNMTYADVFPELRKYIQ